MVPAFFATFSSDTPTRAGRPPPPEATVPAVTARPTTERPRMTSLYSSPATSFEPSEPMSRISPITVRSEVTAPAKEALSLPSPVTKPSKKLPVLRMTVALVVCEAASAAAASSPSGRSI